MTINLITYRSRITTDWKLTCEYSFSFKVLSASFCKSCFPFEEFPLQSFQSSYFFTYHPAFGKKLSLLFIIERCFQLLFHSVQGRLMSMNHCYNDIDRGKPRYSEENLSHCKLARTGPTIRDMGLNAGF